MLPRAHMSSMRAARAFISNHRVLVASIVIFLFWWHLVQTYGTLCVPVVWWHTASYKGPSGGPWAPADYRPKARVVVTMSTRPDRLLPGLLEPTIQSILNQDLKPDAVYLNLPYKNKRSGETYNVPEGLKNMKGLTILRPEDLGPLTKLFPALDEEKDPTTIVISVDDDKSYAPYLLRTLAWNLDKSEDKAFSCCGWSHWWTPYHWQHVIIPVSYTHLTLPTKRIV
eukprot:TRINITY_DN18346_c0_g1_i7.p1 TRINITY_DN18346_c0_g1~~TRINITY_DN18346_c0_g1_i7.p1  ORF type:complete len:226 (-),score=21.28 TRINITY_DN18346_c0_g1_i7:91-768(-)